MKLQWSIQSSHTQLVLSHVVYLNYRNDHIWSPTKMITTLWNFSFGFLQFITFDHFESIQLILRSMFEIFDISIWWTSLWLLGIKHFQYKLLFLFPSQILVYATAFAAHYLFSFWDLHLLSSLSNKNKRVGRDISTSLHMYQYQHDYWLIIHDKLEDRFTTITQRCQDFSHKNISAKLTT